MSTDVNEAPTAAPARGAPRGRAGRGVRRDRPLWLMIPGGLAILLIIVIPFVIALWISLIELDQFTLREFLRAPFVSLGNYAEALQTAGLLNSLRVSVAFAVLTTAVAAPIGVLAALTVQDEFRGRGILRSVYLLPYVIPNFVVAVLWKYLLQSEGPMNTVLGVVGIDGGSWFIGDRAFWTLVLVDIWASWSFVYLLTLSGLQTIDAELYDAVAVDGASWHQKLRYIVLPGIRGPLALALLLSTIHHFNNFTLPYVLFGSPAPESVNVITLNIFETSFQVFRFGLGAAMAVVSLIIVMIPAIAYLRATKLETGHE
jgi:multiple sugar transport system permease protein